MEEAFKKDSGNRTRFMGRIVESMIIRQVIYSLDRSMKAKRWGAEGSMMPRMTKCMKEILQVICEVALEPFIDEMEKY
jgi:hypothetical protein